ncbi:AAA family ATPase [Nonomuraea sp. NPDC003727]
MRTHDAQALIGREHPAALLRAEISRTTASHGGLVLVTGEAGIGKTTLVTSAAERARHDGALVLSGSCWDSEAAPGYWPWVQVIRGLRRTTEWPVVEEAADGSLAALLGDGGASDGGASEGGDAFRVYDAVTTALVAVSQTRPVVVVLDDLHWADGASLRLLEFAAQHTWFERLLLVGTYRDVEVEQGEHPLRPQLSSLSSRATVITLTGLDRAQVAALVARTIGSAPGADVVEEIHLRTGGNPFFVEQTARLWRTNGSVTAIPPGVRDTLWRRLSLLPATVVRLLTDAAVLGRAFHRRVLAAVAAEPVAHVDRLLTQAAAARLVVSQGGGMFAFAHDLVRETLYDSLDEADLRARHAATVHALRDAHEALPGDLARHAYLAGDALDPVAACELLVSAARQALHRLARDESMTHWRRAMERAEAGPPESLIKTGLEYGRHLHHNGEQEEAARVFDRTITAARRLDDPGLLARTALAYHGTCGPHDLRTSVELLRDAHRKLMPDAAAPTTTDPAFVAADAAAGLSSAAEPSSDRFSATRPSAGGPAAGRPVSRPPSADAPSRDLSAPELPSPLLPSAAPSSGDASWPEPPSPPSGAAPSGGPLPVDPRSADRLAQDLAVRITFLARNSDDDEALTFGLWALHDTIWGPGTAGQRVELTAELRELARRGGDADMEHFTSSLHWVALLELGDPRFLDEFDRYVTMGRRSQHAHVDLSTSIDMSIIKLLFGDFAEAESLLEEVVAIGDDHGHTHYGYMIDHHRWALLLAQGRFEELAPVLERLRSGHHHHHAAMLETLTDLRRGRAHTPSPQVGDEPADGFIRPLWLRHLAEVAAASRDPYLCARARRLLRPHLGEWAVSLYGWDVSGPMTLWHGLVEAAEQRWDEAIAAFTAARSAAELLRARPWSVEAGLRLGAALLGRAGPGDAETAERLLGEVTAEAATLGMRHIPAEVERIRQAHNTRAPAPAAGVAQVAETRVARPGDPQASRPIGPDGDEASRMPSRAAAPSADGPGVSARAGQADSGYEFRRQGSVWSLSFGGRRVHVPDAKGLRDLHHLLSRPGTDLPAVQLLAPEAGEAVVAARRMGGDAILDEEAKARYRRHLSRLDEETERALRMGDDARAADLDREREGLLAELRAAVGLGGRSRRLGDEAERARKTVSARIRDVLRKLDTLHPELAAHLRAAVSTGTLCRYDPSGDIPWRL